MLKILYYLTKNLNKMKSIIKRFLLKLRKKFSSIAMPQINAI